MSGSHTDVAGARPTRRLVRGLTLYNVLLLMVLIAVMHHLID